MSHKSSSADANISLIENDAVINDQTGVATVLNDYYVNVTESIDQPELLDVTNIYVIDSGCTCSCQYCNYWILGLLQRTILI